jgi:hypothetical protein
MRRWSIIALVLTACSVPEAPPAGPRAQVLVTVDAEPGVAMASRAVRIRMWGRAADGTFDDTDFLEEPGFRYPWTVALHPEGDVVSRVFRFEAVALSAPDEEGNSNFIAQARLISGYQPGRILHVYLLLQDSCIGVPCEQLSESCRAGRCEPIPEEPTFFDPDAGFPDGGPPPGTDTCMPGAFERCNREDDDCDRRVDEGFDFLSDVDHCGGCGNRCDQPNASGQCIQGRCRVTCDPGFADCNGLAEDGCEASLNDRMSCGACDVQCMGTTPLCAPDGAGGFECVGSCASGLEECDGSCVDLQINEMHCGSCGNACVTAPSMQTTCEAGECVYRCDAGRASCNAALPDGDGCEQNIATDPANCNRCGLRCPMPAACREATCTAGACGERNVMDGRMCEADGRACTVDACMGGTCGMGSTAMCSMDGGMPRDAGTDGGRRDAGRDGGRDAGRDSGPTDSGFDAGALCGATTCQTDETCCGSVCCNVGLGDQCCGPNLCCRMGLEMCITSFTGPSCSLITIDAGTPPTGCRPPCLPGQECCGSTCCPLGSCTGGVCAPTRPDGGRIGSDTP